jgi:hypothetical protein
MTPALLTWAKRHGVSHQALAELFNFAPSTDPTGHGHKLSEAGAQARVRLLWAQRGGALWRNNVGAMQDPDTGQYVRFGLANESTQMNRKIKSSDLVGINPVVVQPHHVGTTIGQFVSRECKKPGWRYKGTDHEEAQLRWLELILAMGGDAAFTTGDV